MNSHNPETSYFKIGAFVLLGLGLIILGLLVFGSQKLFEPTVYVETYFNESVQGISLGTPVKFRGLQIGYVKNITFTGEIYPALRPRKMLRLQNRSIYARLAITSKLFTQLNPEELRQMVQKEVDAGLRIRIAMQGLTGISYLDLDYSKQKATPPMNIRWQPKDIYIPSETSTISELSENLRNILDNLKEVDFKEIFDKVENLTTSITQVANKTDRMLTGINEPFQTTLLNLQAASNNMKTLFDQIKLYPTQMIFGGLPPPLDLNKLGQ